MYFPLIRERVRVKGREGLFTVLSAHYGLDIADLLSISSSETIREVPFASLFASFEDPTAETKISGRATRSGARTSSYRAVASTPLRLTMALRSTARTIADLCLLLVKLEKDRDAYDQVSFAQLRRILSRRIDALTAELRGHPGRTDQRRVA